MQLATDVPLETMRAVREVIRRGARSSPTAAIRRRRATSRVGDADWRTTAIQGAMLNVEINLGQRRAIRRSLRDAAQGTHAEDCMLEGAGADPRSAGLGKRETIQ